MRQIQFRLIVIIRKLNRKKEIETSWKMKHIWIQSHLKLPWNWNNTDMRMRNSFTNLHAFNQPQLNNFFPFHPQKVHSSTYLWNFLQSLDQWMSVWGFERRNDFICHCSLLFVILSFDFFFYFFSGDKVITNRISVFFNKSEQRHFSSWFYCDLNWMPFLECKERETISTENLEIHRVMFENFLPIFSSVCFLYHWISFGDHSLGNGCLGVTNGIRPN